MLAPLEGMQSGEFGEMPELVQHTLRTMRVNGLRLLKLINNLLDLAKIGFSEIQLRTLDRIIKRPNGILLVTGPTGSGKTTTLHACISRINDSEKKGRLMSLIATNKGLDRTSRDYVDLSDSGKADVDKCPQSAAANGVMSVPTVAFFKGGEMVDKLVGQQSKATLVEKVQALSG